MKKIFIICVMILSYQISNAQNKISGKITDQDNLPLIGASIFVTDMNLYNPGRNVSLNLKIPFGKKMNDKD
jgi:hypothetical protein